jgi:hypothetical protein
MIRKHIKAINQMNNKYRYEMKDNKELTFFDILLMHPCGDEFSNAINFLGNNFTLNSNNVQRLMDAWEETRPAWFAYLVNKGLIEVKKY